MVFNVHGLLLLINVLVILSIDVSDAANCDDSICKGIQECTPKKYCSDALTTVCTVPGNCTAGGGSGTCETKCVCKGGYSGNHCTDCGGSTCSANQECPKQKYCSDVTTKITIRELHSDDTECNAASECGGDSPTCAVKCVCKAGYSGEHCTVLQTGGGLNQFTESCK